MSWLAATREFIPGWVNCVMLERTGWVQMSSVIYKCCTYTFSFIIWRSPESWLEPPEDAVVGLEPRGSSVWPWFLWREKIKGGISIFWTISHIETQLADDDNGKLPRCGRGGYKEVSMGLQLEVGVSGYRPKLFSGDSLDERDRW